MIRLYGTFLCIAISFGLHSQLIAQHQLPSVGEARPGFLPVYLDFTQGMAPDFQINEILGTTSTLRSSGARSPKLELITSEADELGFTHYRYRQLINGLPLLGAEMIVHEKGGKIMFQNGLWATEELQTQMPKPRGVIAEEKAFQAALDTVHAKLYAWQAGSFLEDLDGHAASKEQPKGQLTYLNLAVDDEEPRIVLAYAFDIMAYQPHKHFVVYIDAFDGTCLGREQRICSVKVPTMFNGIQDVNTTWNAAKSAWTLRDMTRGKGVITLNAEQGPNGTTTDSEGQATYGSNEKDYLSSNNQWNLTGLSRYATDLHFYSTKYYDFLKTRFGRNGIDNKNKAMIGILGTTGVNAFWDGNVAVFYTGNESQGIKPFAGVDIVGHEYAHGLTEFTAGLYYFSESGALNEALSDMYGKTFEKWLKPNAFSWLVGRESNFVIRNMSNPNVYKNPITYQGRYWIRHGNPFDYSGVHINSGVANYWFYLLCEGKKAQNEFGRWYEVNPIGMDKAINIVYRAQSLYLTPGSTFRDFANATFRAAVDLYGQTSVKDEVYRAWMAVNVFETNYPDCKVDNSQGNVDLNDNVRTSATSVKLNQRIIGKLNSSNDQDWYKFQLSGNTDIVLSYNHPFPALPADRNGMNGNSIASLDFYYWNSSVTVLDQQGDTVVCKPWLPIYDQSDVQACFTLDLKLQAGTYYVVWQKPFSNFKINPGGPFLRRYEKVNTNAYTFTLSTALKPITFSECIDWVKQSSTLKIDQSPNGGITVLERSTAPDKRIIEADPVTGQNNYTNGAGISLAAIVFFPVNGFDGLGDNLAYSTLANVKYFTVNSVGHIYYYYYEPAKAAYVWKGLPLAGIQGKVTYVTYNSGQVLIATNTGNIYRLRYNETGIYGRSRQDPFVFKNWEFVVHGGNSSNYITSLACDSWGNPWITLLDKSIYDFRKSRGWRLLPGAASKITIYSNVITVIGTDGAGYTWTGNGWERLGGSNFNDCSWFTDGGGTKYFFAFDRNGDTWYKDCNNVYLSNTTSPRIASSKRSFQDPGIVALSEVALFPNPAQNEFAIRFHSATREKQEIRIYDLLGRVVHHETHFADVGENLKTIQINPLQNGTYLVRLGNRSVGKLVIAK
jgi:Zn-dependent metalloprotease